MQPNSAIRGCSNWYWLDPVYKSDAASCYSYCQQYGADACEWTAEHDGASNPGDCYVEYGDSCTVASGYSGWSAAVLNLGGPPAGGGGGDGEMHSNSAVRGCVGWWWWDPAYQPTADACANYCVQNNADACEWYTNGECYVEFGSSCYVEPGYAGWSARVRALKCVLACIAIVVALAPQQVTGQDAADVQPVLRRVELLEATQLRMLRELESISTQLAEGRKAAPAGPLRVSPPPPVIPSSVQSISDAAMKGSADAAVVLIEYADFQCPYCGQFARQILPEIEKRYVSTGKLRVVFRHMPLQEIHPQAVMAAETAECARQQGKFWQVHDALFADQRLDEASLVEKARTNGVGDRAVF